ncbi:hypothetical protein TARUN_6186 [Trichoderma arundinaceum]|uniref:Uncharacterized protein n=1 Tax=Trichoderma arundinaceum TaxID=490622 RepID=A0A395NJ49_TRIAR|nr:hypothetical protein TARUN_6186 [Trichoderma arundinaceum]
MDAKSPIFEYRESSQRVLFGAGVLAKLGIETAALGCTEPLLLTTPQQARAVQDLTNLLNGHVAGSFTRATMHTPTDVTEEALAYAKTTNADCLVSIGGGSTIGLGKALSLRTGLPHICIATTYSGSEMTPIVGETKNHQKVTRIDRAAIPKVVFYDVSLTLSLPTDMSATSGLNAMAHAVEALYAKDTSPIVGMFALAGIRSLASSLPQVVKNPRSIIFRSEALLGAWFCGKCLAMTTVALHHKLCHVLGGVLNLPHAETHAIILPHALAYTAPDIPQVMKDLAENIPHSEGDAIQGLNRLLSKLGIPSGLRDLGMKEEDIGLATDNLMKTSFWNPRPVNRDSMQKMIRRAWLGEQARADI